MELTKKYIHMNREKGKAFSQMALDDDFNIPDIKPDVLRLIQDSGEVKLEEINVSPGHIWLKGVLKFQVLYRSEVGEGRICSLVGEVPFQENLVLDGVVEEDNLRIHTQIEDLSIGIINSRKLSIKALVELRVVASEIFDEAVAIEVEEKEGVQVLESKKNVLQLLLAKKDTYRFREEIMLPSNKPNIREVLWKRVQLRGVETRLVENQMQLKGEAFVFALYLGEEEETRLQWLETALPFTGVIDCPGCDENMTLDIAYDVASIELEPKPDYDGEERVLHLEMLLDMNIHIYQEDEVQILEDVYATNCRLLPEYESAVFEQLLMRNFAKCRISERLSIAEGQEAILQICAGEGNIVTEQVEIVPDGLQIEGMLGIKILYITADDKNPVASLKAGLPFHQFLEVPGITEQSRYQLEACLEQLTILMLDSMQVEVKAVLNLNAIVFEKNLVPRIVKVVEEPLDMEMLQERPGIVGYIGRPGESLWNIAKDNFTTIANMKEMNHINEEVLKGGEKILIIKTVG